MEMPEMPTGYWSADKLALMWHYIRWFLKENMVWIMLVVGMFLAVGFIHVVTSMFSKDDDDNDFEYM